MYATYYVAQILQCTFRYNLHKLRIHMPVLSIQLCLTLCDFMDRRPPDSSVHGIHQGKNAGVGFHFLLQGLFLTEESNPHLLSPALVGCSLPIVTWVAPHMPPSWKVSMYACSVTSVASNPVTLWTVDHQAPLSMGFSRQEYWSGLPRPPSGDLPNPVIKPTTPTSPALQTDSLPT